MEKRSLEPLASITLPAAPEVAIRPEAVVAVRLNAVAIESANYWRRLVRERIAPHYRKYMPPESNRSEESQKLGYLERLLDFGEFAGISEIWLNSAYVRDGELTQAGRRRAKPLTRQSLSRRLKELARAAGEDLDLSVYEARASRLVEAMLSYGLLEEEVVRSNLKPLRATALLHVLMTAYHSNLALLWARAIDGGSAADAGEGEDDNV